MDVFVHFPGFPAVTPAQIMPAALAAYAIPGSTPYSMDGPFGQVLVQEIAQGSIVLHYVIVQAKTAFGIKMVIPAAYSQAQCMLEGRLPFLPTHYFRTAVARGEIQTRFESGQVYRLLLLSQPTPAPAVQTLQPLSPVMMGHLYTLLHTPFILTVQQFYLATIKSLWDEVHREVTALTQRSLYPEETIIALHKTRAFIEEHAPVHFPIGTLASKAGLNRQAFKQGFKALFGKGPYAYLLQYRLEQARREVENSRKPLKQIARQAGYTNAGNFAKAFKRQFEMTPKEMRRFSHYTS